MTEGALADLDFTSPAFRANPYPMYDQMRMQAPRLLSEKDHYREWLFTRYEDVAMVLKDHRFIKEQTTLMQNPSVAPSPSGAERNPLYQMFDNWMLFRDPPTHTRLRSLVNQAFTPRMIERLGPRISAIAESLLTPLRDQEHFDLINAYAFPLPVIVIAEMLGVPAEDRAMFREWSTAISSTLEFGSVDQATVERGGQMAKQVMDYFRQLVRARRKAPKADVISSMIAAEEQGTRLSEDELLATCVLLLFAGHETTVNLIGNSVALLLAHPDTHQLLRETPALMPSAVEEFLRFESPVQLTNRFAAQDVVIGQDVIRRGDNVNVFLGAANRDPDVFANPHQLDVQRHPNRHLAFAAGPHFCIGAPLARMEGVIAIESLLTHYIGIEPAYEHIDWRQSGVFRGPLALPVRVR
ncbi:MAG: cytochrome P450 [Firmicutes bacterium]|nr:cytochrome P450 [Bacillota bacterium]